MNQAEERRWRSTGKEWGAVKPLARVHRHGPTAAESALWQALRSGALGGFRFRRQHAIGRFIVDFYCSKAFLVIEVDGQIHETNAVEDAARQAFLESLGLKVLRFSNADVLESLAHVLETVRAALSPPDPAPPPGPPPPLRRAERGLGGEV